MPKGNPTAAQLWQGDVSFFSLDTDLIQAAGYNFEGGALKQLPKQLPDTMSLQLSEVVAQEIVSHRMAGVTKAVDGFKSSSNELKRLASISMDDIDQCFEKLTVGANAWAYFYQQIKDYTSTCQGQILPIDGHLLAQRIFDLYFDTSPPFGTRKDKKTEFPDATSLLLLEDFAKDKKTMGLIASGDDGWSKFADASDYLYCVRSIDDLAALFSATDAYAKAIESKVIESVQSNESSLRDSLHDALVEHVSDSSWSATDVVSHTVSRVEAEVYDTKFKDYKIESAEVWSISPDKKTWVIELNITAAVELSISAEFFAWDSIDREEVSLGVDVFPSESTIEIQVYFTCGGVEEDSQPEDWDIEIEIAKGHYECDPMDVEPDFYD
ncbi:PIN domain-containing protein [Pseudomonas sp. S3(2024)]|uniref:PIN domain-containing protein n=1 Tax=Pseudomonas sp. S3(2024) TaxID=3111912 RepID=UPI002FDFE3C1